jgi:hypothetical protein
MKPRLCGLLIGYGWGEAFRRRFVGSFLSLKAKRVLEGNGVVLLWKGDREIEGSSMKYRNLILI